jgi:hypothetical protein
VTSVLDAVLPAEATKSMPALPLAAIASLIACE